MITDKVSEFDKSFVLWVSHILFLATLGLLALLEFVIAPIGAGYFAKGLCSEVFVAGRSSKSVKSSDLNRFWYIQGTIDPHSRTSRASLFGFGKQKAIYRKNLGCTLNNGKTINEIQRYNPKFPQTNQNKKLEKI